MTEAAQSLNKNILCSFCSSLRTESPNAFNVLEFYSGIGGMRCALQESQFTSFPIKVNFEAFDINTSANTVYEHNFGKSDVNQRNIISLSADEFDNLTINLITMSPPCQPFTRQGLKRDVEDFRCDSFVHIVEEVIPKMRLKPKCVLIENVKGFEESEAREMVVKLLEKEGYDIREFLLSPTQFGIPNSRLRYYLLAKLGISSLCLSETTSLITDIPKMDLHESCINCRNHFFPNSENNVNPVIVFEKKRILDFVDLDIKNDEKKANEYYLPDKVLNKYATILDIVDYSSDRSCCFTRGYTAMVLGTGSVLKSYDDIDVDNVYAKIEKWTENEEIEKSRQRIDTLRQLKLRYFSPKEVANLMCFPQSFEFPPTLTNRQKYKLLGNSINVRVISFLLNILLINKKQC